MTARHQIPASFLALAHRYGTRIPLTESEILFLAGAPVHGLHLVIHGALRVVRASGGRAMVVHRETEGGMLGEVALFGGGRYPATAVATEPSEVLFIPERIVDLALSSDVTASRWLLNRLAMRLQEVIGRLDQVAHHTVRRRLASYLLARAERPRAANREEVAVTLGMTLDALADELGTVKPIIVRELGLLRRERIIEAVGRGRYRILDAEVLRARH